MKRVRHPLATLRQGLALWLLLDPGVWAQTITSSAEDKAPIVLVEPVTVTELSDLITYPARVISKVKGAVYSLSDGLVTHIFSPLGAAVNAGDLLFEVKNTDPAYDYRPVYMPAPVGGVMSSVDVTEGSSVVKGQALATVTDPRKTQLRVEIPAADLAHFHRGLVGKFRLPQLGEAFVPLDVRVLGISPMVDPLTGTASAEVAFVHPGAKAVASVPLGALGKVAFAINPHQGMEVPEQSIVYRGSATYVRTVQEKTARLVPVILGDTYRGRTEVKSGLDRRAMVIVVASSFIADGQRVNVQHVGSPTN